MAAKSTLIPRNTLVGLPDELLKTIVGYAIDSNALVDSTRDKTASIEEDLVGPFQADQKLEIIANEHVYDNNTFRRKVRWVEAYEERHRKFMKLELDDEKSRRYDIKHLDLQVNIMLDEDVAAMAKATARVIRKLPRLYRNLDTLSVTIWRHCPGNICYNSVGRQDPDNEYVNTVVSSHVSSVVEAMRSMRAPWLDTRYVTLEQADYLDELLEQARHEQRAPCRIDGRDIALEQLTWMMLDHPSVSVRL